MKEFQDLGVHVITTGNHIWDNWKVKTVLSESRFVLRPLNYPKDNAGFGFFVVDLKEKGRIGVLNLQGRTYMQPLDDPFRSADCKDSYLALYEQRAARWPLPCETRTVETS